MEHAAKTLRRIVTVIRDDCLLRFVLFIASQLETGAGEESRTLDLNLGKVALYQLSYSRVDNKRAL